MQARIDRVTGAVNTWIVGDDEEVIVVAPGESAAAGIDAAGERDQLLSDVVEQLGEERAQLLREGDDICIVAMGSLLHLCLQAAAQLAAQTGKPVGFGVTGPGMTREQAVDRIDNARNAVESVIRLLQTLKQIDSA